jgi:hypothetical protein
MLNYICILFIFGTIIIPEFLICLADVIILCCFLNFDIRVSVGGSSLVRFAELDFLRSRIRVFRCSADSDIYWKIFIHEFRPSGYFLFNTDFRTLNIDVFPINYISGGSEICYFTVEIISERKNLSFVSSVSIFKMNPVLSARKLSVLRVIYISFFMTNCITPFILSRLF